MAAYRVFLTGERTPLEVELYYDRLDDVMSDASRARFITGQMTNPDEHGVLRQIMIATGRIQCVIEVD